MRSHYANNTSVSVDRSRAEIETILKKHGAEKFMYAWDADKAVIAFRAGNRNIKFAVPLPRREDFKATHTGRHRKISRIEDIFEAETRRKWRALALLVKAKLVGVQDGIASFETEFMPYTVLPNGRTVAEEVAPMIEDIYSSGKMIPLLTQ